MSPVCSTPISEISDDDLWLEIALRSFEPQCLGVRRRMAVLEQEWLRRTWERSA